MSRSGSRDPHSVGKPCAAGIKLHAASYQTAADWRMRCVADNLCKRCLAKRSCCGVPCSRAGVAARVPRLSDFVPLRPARRRSPHSCSHDQNLITGEGVTRAGIGCWIPTPRCYAEGCLRSGLAAAAAPQVQRKPGAVHPRRTSASGA